MAGVFSFLALPCLHFSFFLGPQYCALRAPIWLPPPKTHRGQEPTFCEQMYIGLLGCDRDGRRGQGVGQSLPSVELPFPLEGSWTVVGRHRVRHGTGVHTRQAMPAPQSRLRPGLVRAEVSTILEPLLKKRDAKPPGPLPGFLQMRGSQLKLH